MSQIGDILQVVANILQPDGTFATNIFYCEHQAGTTTGQTGEVNDMTTWLTAIYTPMLPLMSANFVVDSLKVYVYNTVTGLFDPRGTGNLALAGTDLSSALPNVNAAFVRAYSTNPRSTARKYWPAMAENEVGDNIIGVAALLALAAVSTQWVGQFAPSGDRVYQPVVWSKKDITSYWLTGTTIIDAIISHQNRRKPGVGS